MTSVRPNRVTRSRTGRPLWPFGAQWAIATTVLLLALLVIGAAALRAATQWPPASLDQIVFLVIVVLAFVPIALSILDLVADRGGSIGFRGFTVDFASDAPRPQTFTVPHNIGLPGLPVTDSASDQILEVLRRSTTTDIVVLDLEDGTAWWETRLLVLLEGAVRLGRPAAVVFTATEGGDSDRFQGWAPPSALLPLLARSDERYERVFANVRAWSRQWELVPPPVGGAAVVAPTWMQGTGPNHQWMLFDSPSGLPKTLGVEQLLQSELGREFEMNRGYREVTLSRLQELFRAVLRTASIDETWPPERQVDAVLSSDDPYLPVTNAGHYVRTMTRTAALAGILRSIVTAAE